MGSKSQLVPLLLIKRDVLDQYDLQPGSRDRVQFIREAVELLKLIDVAQF